MLIKSLIVISNLWKGDMEEQAKRGEDTLGPKARRNAAS